MAVVLSERNEPTPSLVDTNLVLMIKNDANHNDVHHVQLRHGQDSFPLHFNLTNVKEIQATGEHLLTVLIFGYTHRLLWEGILFRQHLLANQQNHITFHVQDVCE